MSASDFRDPIGRIRLVGMVEGVSFLILLACSAAKRLADMPLGVKIFGPIHGALFVLLLYLIFQAWGNRILTKRQALVAGIASVVPFLPFIIDRLLAENATQSGDSVD
jgi:integral membrane protein